MKLILFPRVLVPLIYFFTGGINAEAQQPSLAPSSQTVPRFLGTKTPYIAPDNTTSQTPAGFKPVYINYVGRHGARFLTKAGADKTVWEVLSVAEKNNSLTAAGKKIKEITGRLLDLGKGKYENITLLGAEEQEAIGTRLNRQYKTVFTGKGIDVETTYKVRTQQSADAFFRAFSGYTGQKKMVQAPDSLDTSLRFYDLSSAYQRYKKSSSVKMALDTLEKDKRTAATAMNICSKIFDPAFTERLKKGGVNNMNVISFAENLYDLYAISFSMIGEMKEKGYPVDSMDLGIVFADKDLEWLDFCSGAADFLEKGPGFDSLGIQVRVAVPLLVDFIGSMDRVIQHGPNEKTGTPMAISPGPDAILRFTHAEAISPFAALLGIRNACTPVRSIRQYRTQWQASAVVPLSANIQWILYQKEGPEGKEEKHPQEYLVKILLNEKVAVLPLTTDCYPYYPWKDLRNYYIQKLEALHTGLDKDMRKYLKELN